MSPAQCHKNNLLEVTSDRLRGNITSFCSLTWYRWKEDKWSSTEVGKRNLEFDAFASLPMWKCFIPKGLERLICFKRRIYLLYAEVCLREGKGKNISGEIVLLAKQYCRNAIKLHIIHIGAAWWRNVIFIKNYIFCISGLEAVQAHTVCCLSFVIFFQSLTPLEA